MNNELVSFLEDKKVSVKSFDEPLAKFIINVYSMPKWNKDEVENTKQQILYLIDSSKLVAENILESDLNKINNMSAYSKLIKSAQDLAIEKIQEIYPTGAIFQYVGQIYQYLVKNSLADEKKAETVCESLGIDIGVKKKDDEVIKQHMVTIHELLSKSLCLTIVSIKENLLSGANAGFVVTTEDKRKYFVKTFSESFGSPSFSTKKIDCRELFAYKVLEYLGFGPETECLIQKFSSSQGSKTKGNYIATKDVSVIDKENELEKEFFRDGDKNDLAYYEAMKSKDFLVELFSLASLNSILRLRDTFGDNTGNYGIIKTMMKDESIKYEPILIYHLPCTSNGIIDKSYSPGRFLAKSLNFNTEKDSNLQRVITENFSSKNMKLTEEVQRMVNDGKRGKNLKTSLDGALKYVLELIEKNSNSFTDEQGEQGVISAEEIIKKHAGVVWQNHETFLNFYK